jgi:prepilin-type N-terminal cleavage/methylation domain-containing protein
MLGNSMGHETWNMKHGTLNTKTGFTLIEVLVVLGIFTMLGLLITNVFLLSLRAQRQTSYRQETLANLRFVMETMTQNIRTSEIDYSLPLDPNVLNLSFGSNRYSYSLDSGKIVLTTETETGSNSAPLTSAEDVVVFRMNFFIDPPADPFVEERCNIAADCAGAADECTIEDPEASEKDFKAGFCICNTNNPATIECAVTKHCVANQTPSGEALCLPFDRQPRVTITLGFNPVGQQLTAEPLYLETTVSSRVYKR